MLINDNVFQRILIHQGCLPDPDNHQIETGHVFHQRNRFHRQIRRKRESDCLYNTYPLSPKTMTLSKVLLLNVPDGELLSIESANLIASTFDQARVKMQTFPLFPALPLLRVPERRETLEKGWPLMSIRLWKAALDPSALPLLISFFIYVCLYVTLNFGGGLWIEMIKG